MNRFKYFMMALFGMLAGLPVFAEGEQEATAVTKVNTAVQSWVDAAKSAVEGWIDKLGPLFLVGLGIVLLLLGWSLFRKVTNKAKG